MSTEAIRAQEAETPTTELVTGAVGGRCTSCGAPLASDQRYCVNCGERRGKPRFSYDTVAARNAAAGAVEPPLPPVPPRPRFSSGATLVAGVATLLIALGVGVLIGHNSNATNARAPAAQVITLGGGAGASTGAATTRSGGSTASTGKAGKTAKRTVVKVNAKAAKAATAAASKVLGSSHNLSNNVSQSVGGSCSGGAGCQNGKFSGNYFPTG